VSRHGALRVNALAALPLVIAACGSEAAPIARSTTVAAEHVRIVGGTAAQRELLDEIVAGLRPRSLTYAGVARPPRRARPVPPGAVSIEVAGGGGTRARWEEYLVAGAFRDVSAQRGLPPVATMLGGRTSFPERIGPPLRVVPPAPAGGAARRHLGLEVRVLARQAGTRAEEVDVVAPYGLAVAARLRIRDPMLFVYGGLDTLLRGLGRRGLDGFLLEVVDQHGEPVVDYARSARAGGSIGQVYRAELAGCLDVGFRRLDPGGPSRCPVDY
jgi:hypothetical protein